MRREVLLGQRERRRKEWVDVFDLELTGFLSLSPALITFVTVNQLWLRHWDMRSGLIKTLFQPHHRNLYRHINTVTRTRCCSNSQSNRMTDRNQYTHTHTHTHTNTTHTHTHTHTHTAPVKHSSENECLQLVLLTNKKQISRYQLRYFTWSMFKWSQYLGTTHLPS